ncbi:MAG: winged helix DNA-binding domain-containing protein, partial [Gemmatimonadaceae bacterium]
MTPARGVAKAASKAAPATMTVRQLNRAFLARQMLLARERRPAVDAIRALMALQAQVPRPPFIGLWTRLTDFDAEELRSALRKRQVVRVTAMRVTLHLMATDDYLAHRGTLQPMLARGAAAILRSRMTDGDVARFNAIGRDFFGKTPATFDTLRNFLTASDPKGDVRATAYGVRCHVPLVQVPTDAVWAYPASADFLLADTYLKRKVVLKAGSLEEIVRRYLAAFGPATPADAQAWSGMQGLRETFEALRPSLVVVRDERRRELFDLPDAPRPTDEIAAPVRFLPEFDNTMLGHDDRTRVVSDEHRRRLATKNLQV